MSLTYSYKKILTLLALLAMLSVAALADTIRLKDGSTIKGKILSFENGQFVILIGSGDRQRQIRFFADEIESIQFESQASPATPSLNPNTKGPSYSTKTEGNSTIITVGSSSKTPNPQPKPAVTEQPTPRPEPPAPTTTTNTAKPIQIRVKVLADNTANGWTNAGWVVRKGQRIKITGTGRISLGNGRFSGPRGISTLPDSGKLIGDKPTGSLIAVIGDDNNDFIFVGEGVEFVAERDGALFLGVNEGVLDDNSGSFEVTVEIDPNVGT